MQLKVTKEPQRLAMPNRKQKSRDFITNVENQIEVLESKDLLTEGERKNLSHLRKIFVNYEKEKSKGY